MNLTKTALQNLKKESDSDLKKDVLRIILNSIDGYEKPEGWFEDLMSHGCVSGMVGELIYYSDTVKFFEKHKEDIFELAIEQAERMGSKNVMEFIGGLNGAENVGSFDQFANLMSWYAFEETVRQIYEVDFEKQF